MKQKASLLKIEKGIPIPAGNHRASTGITSRFRKMEVGDSILIQKSQKGSAYTCARMVGAQVKIRSEGDDTARVWVVKKAAA